MPKKAASLSKALQEVATRREPPVVTAPEAAAAPGRAPSREGKKAIAGFFDPAVSRQLKQIGLEQDRSVQDLLREALNDLFEKHGRSPIA